MVTLSERKELLLKLVIENFVKTADPVGSAFLADRSQLGLSGATLRNELRELEEAGYLTHPHTSAGRIPTEQGYQYYIDHLMQIIPVHKAVKESLDDLAQKSQDTVKKIKFIAKYIGLHAHLAVIVGLDEDSLYYTGLTNLFAQPEFRDYAQAMNVSAVFDHLEDRVVDLIRYARGSQPKILLGQGNPLGHACGSVIISCATRGFFAVTGPMRMEYGKMVGILSYVQKLI